MKSLYNEYEALTKDGMIVSEEIEDAIRLIVNKHIGQYPLRELQSVISSTVGMIICEEILLKATRIRKGQVIK